jgi:YggT family protein
MVGRYDSTRNIFKFMLYQIISLLLEVVIGLVAGACLLRLYMQYQRIPMSARSGNPLGRFVFALTDWLVLPLRRVVPSLGRWDMASLVAAFLLEVVQFLVLWLLAGAAGGLVTIPILATFGLVRLALSGMTGLIIVYAVLSWVQSRNVLSDIIERLCAPPLIPIRRVVPLVGGVDLSPLVLLVLLQVASIVLGAIQGAVLL